jgi:hypothetical protein
LVNVKQRVTQVFATGRPTLATSARSKKSESLAIAPLQFDDSEFSQEIDLWKEVDKALEEEAEEIPFEDEGLRRSLSRRVSESWRRSWVHRRSYLSVIGIGDDDDDNDWDTEGTEKVKRVRKLRDWSRELSEDDIGESPCLIKRTRNTPIIWTERACDIGTGQYWHYISPMDC